MQTLTINDENAQVFDTRGDLFSLRLNVRELFLWLRLL